MNSLYIYLYTQCVCVCSVASVVSDSVRPHGLQLPGSSIHGILQARILEWGAIPIPGYLFKKIPGDLFDPRIEPESLQSPALVGRFFTTSIT